VQLNSYQLWACVECASWTLLPRPALSDQSAYHDTGAYFDHPYLVLRRAHTEAVERRCDAMLQRIAKVFDVTSLRGQRILDVGCDTGQTILAASRRCNSIPVGIDVAHRAVVMARAAGVEAHLSVLENAPPGLSDFPLVTAIDLIEHVADPEPFFRALAERLRPGGIAYVEKPNLRSYIYRCGRVLGLMSGCRPAAVFERLFLREHVQYYSRKGLEHVARPAGLDVIALDTRDLPRDEIAVGWAVRLGLMPLQAADSLAGDRALLWAILQRPRESAISKSREEEKGFGV
jgi:SAM-dependent methyltransferase